MVDDDNPKVEDDKQKGLLQRAIAEARVQLEKEGAKSNPNERKIAQIKSNLERLEQAYGA